MGKLISGKSLRLGITSDWNSSQDVSVGWYGWRVLRDKIVSDYVCGLIRMMMMKEEGSFRDWGFWFSKCEFYTACGVTYLGIYVYEGEIDNFCGRVVYQDRFEKEEDKKFILWLRKKVYSYIGRVVEVDFKHIFNEEVRVVIFPLKVSEVTAGVLGELVVRRVYDGESVYDVFRDIKRSFGLDKVKKKLYRKTISLRKNTIGKRVRLNLMNSLRMGIFDRGKNSRMSLLRGKYDFKKKARERVFKRSRRLEGGFKISGIKGFRLQGDGMFVRKHKSMSQNVRVESGYVALSSLVENVDYCKRHVNLRTSKCGVKVWLNKVDSDVRDIFKQGVKL